MSTRSRIGIFNDDQTITSIYCHFDGYPEGVGAKLITYWAHPDKLNELMQLGDISALGEVIGDKHDFDWRSDLTGPDGLSDWAAAEKDPRAKWTLAYGRDRGETETEAMVHPSLEAFRQAADSCGADFTYLLIDGQWAGWDYRRNLIDFNAALEA
jgi:hypothetical protein